jgi:hypothetical protein
MISSKNLKCTDLYTYRSSLKSRLLWYVEVFHIRYQRNTMNTCSLRFALYMHVQAATTHFRLLILFLLNELFSVLYTYMLK